ncbi:MAG: hypothetical protein KF833_12295 [Verrucomicrobiae bacterium]|nr:hypothetical protein [Verrucomicrobiae bacterium]
MLIRRIKQHGLLALVAGALLANAGCASNRQVTRDSSTMEGLASASRPVAEPGWTIRPVSAHP